MLDESHLTSWLLFVFGCISVVVMILSFLRHYRQRADRCMGRETIKLSDVLLLRK